MNEIIVTQRKSVIFEFEIIPFFIKKLKEQNILAGYKLNKNQILVCTTEMNSKEDIDKYIQNA